MTRADQIVLSNAALTVQVALSRWTRKPDLPATLCLLGALSALCRDLTFSVGKQAEHEGHKLLRYDEVIDSAAMLAAIGNSINYVGRTCSYKQQHKIGLYNYCPPITAPLVPDVLEAQLLEELALLETSAERLDLSMVRTLSSLYVFADAAYAVAVEAHRIARESDDRRQSIGELVSVAQHFRNNCNPR